jgi:dethiobiotin synthetase
MTVLVVTGTGTEIGKTVVTAAVAALATGRVAVVKPAQTGLGPGEPGDVDTVGRLSGVTDLHELVRYPEPLAPATAARRAGLAALPLASMITAVRALADRDLLLVEGAGGALVRLDADGRTIADLAAALGAGVLVVAAAGLGTLNAAALTVEALDRRGLTTVGVVVGSWPAEPDLAERCNLDDLPAYTGVPLLGAIPAGSGSLAPQAFREVARRSLAPELGGVWQLPDPV